MQPINKGQKAKYDGVVLSQTEYEKYEKVMLSLREYLTQKTIYDAAYHV